MRLKGIHTFPGKFKVLVITDNSSVSSFVAGRHDFNTEGQLDRHIDKLGKHLKIRGIKGCRIRVEQL